MQPSRGGARALARARQRLNEQLQRQVDELRTLLEILPVGVWRADPQCERIVGNAAAYRMLGLDPGRNASLTASRDPLHGVRCMQGERTLGADELPMQRVARTGQSIEQFEHEIVFDDGRRVAVYCNVAPERDPASGRVDGVVGVYADITERKRREDAVRLLSQAAASLLDAGNPGQMLDAVFGSIRQPLGLDMLLNYMVVDGAPRLRLDACIGVDDEAARALATLEFGEAVCGTVAQRRTPIVLGDVQRGDDALAAAIRRLGARAYACCHLLAGERLLGTLSFASRSRDAFSVAELDMLATISRYVASAHERLRLMRQLEEANRRKDDFLAIVAHETRNLLAPVRSAAHVLVATAPRDERAGRIGELLQRQVGQMARLMDDLVDVNRIVQRKLELRRAAVALGVLIEDAIETARPLIERKAHRLEVELPAEPLPLDVDAARMSQVFANLLLNAAKYTPRGGTIGIGARREGDRVCVSVRDSGVGIAPELQPRIFELFAQGPMPAGGDAPAGIGVGLAIARGIVELHGGSIEVRSAGANAGSEFRLMLPLAALDDAPASDAAQPAAPASAAASAPVPAPTLRAAAPCRVLVVDDRSDVADSLGLLLRSMGHEVRSASDGRSAVELAAAFRPQLVLLNLTMPAPDGFETCRLLRQQPWAAGLRIVAHSGLGRVEDRARALHAGFDDHLVKPASAAELARLLASPLPAEPAAAP